MKDILPQIEEILKAVWYSGKNESLDFFACLDKENWSIRILALIKEVIGMRGNKEMTMQGLREKFFERIIRYVSRIYPQFDVVGSQQSQLLEDELIILVEEALPELSKGYVRLSEDQKLPSVKQPDHSQSFYSVCPLCHLQFQHHAEGQVESWMEQAQQDMLKAGWRKVELGEVKL